ncbi:hypothetical protein [Catellatospora coxensis]|uniref:Excalibur calcium-binding domain-containing protein n=1 Tax=Catellatospora coxensis TaxID=310354 RepID=A0A8J3P5A4_9ACTN|nr:hypothetical protein [Catellatospora coxensis]GIG04638.1 hypothetical protein Cco03nite_13380 [Catellatospora coxensis]
MNTSTRTALRLLAAAAVLLTVATGLGPSTATAGPAAWVAFHPSRPAEVRPFVQSFARKPQARPQRALPKPKRPPEVPVGIDGCDHGYHMPQRPGLCVPWRFPPGVRARCDWLRGHAYFDPASDGTAPRLLVRGTDRHRLDTDHDGEACEKSERPAR